MNDQDLLTLYAGLAMQGIITLGIDATPISIAKTSFDIAEAMIKEQGERNERLRPARCD
jgi:hypothetical protein